MDRQIERRRIVPAGRSCGCTDGQTGDRLNKQSTGPQCKLYGQSDRRADGRSGTDCTSREKTSTTVAVWTVRRTDGRTDGQGQTVPAERRPGPQWLYGQSDGQSDGQTVRDRLYQQREGQDHSGCMDSSLHPPLTHTLSLGCTESDAGNLASEAPSSSIDHLTSFPALTMPAHTHTYARTHDASMHMRARTHTQTHTVSNLALGDVCTMPSIQSKASPVLALKQFRHLSDSH